MHGIKGKCLLLALSAAVFVGCGDADAVHTSAALSEAAAQSADTGAADAETEETEEAKTTEGEEAKNGEAQEEDASDTEESAEPIADANFMALMEMDETLKNQLAEEMLEENEMDTSVVESAPVTKGCNFTLPEAFSESEDIEGMYVTRRYPIDASTIYYVALGRDGAAAYDRGNL